MRRAGRRRVHYMKLEKTLEKLDTKRTVLIVVPPTRTQDTAHFVARVLSQKIGQKGLFLVLSRPAERAKEELERLKIDTKNIFFIDTLSASMGSEVGWKGNVLYISNPADITEMGIAVSNFIEKHKGRKWVLVDSLVTLKLYTTEEMLAKFAQTLTVKAGSDVQLVVITAKMKDDSLANRIIPFFDEVVKAE